MSPVCLNNSIVDMRRHLFLLVEETEKVKLLVTNNL